MSGNVLTTYEAAALYGYAGDNATFMDDGKYHAPGSRRIIIVRSGHGSDGTGVGPLGGVIGFFEVTRACVDAGYTVYNIDAAGPASWWNQNSTTAMQEAISYVQSKYGVSKVALFGGSMGTGVCIQSLKTSTIKSAVCGFAGISAAVDLDYFHGTAGYTPPYTYNTTETPTFGNWASDCQTAYGTTAAGWAAATVGHLIRNEPSSWVGLPFPAKVWHGDADNVVPYAQVVWWMNQLDANWTLRTLPGAFHTPALPSQLGPPLDEYIEFFDSLDWT